MAPDSTQDSSPSSSADQPQTETESAQGPGSGIRYAWQGWNDPAHQREQMGREDPGHDAPEGASSPAYTTGSGRSVPERAAPNPPRYGVDSPALPADAPSETGERREA